MGLAGGKTRSKLSHDPNNNAWSKSTTTFGHRMLTAQGWKPGDYLGAENANHADHFTAANASHIRIMLREENLGVGAKIGRGNAETFGLSLFSGILGRLNGKDEVDLKKQEDAMRDVELRTYQTQKYGFMNFVRGGLLVGDKIEEFDSTKDKSISAESAAAAAVGTERPLKRKASVPADAANEKLETKRKAGSTVVLKSTTASEGAEKTTDLDTQTKLRKRQDKEDRKRERARRKSEEAGTKSSASVADGETSRLREEKRARKEERRRRKEEKRQKKAAKQELTTSSSEDEESPTPPITAKAAPANLHRHAVRQRYIQQKRMASMDPQALKEIFMFQAAKS